MIGLGKVCEVIFPFFVSRREGKGREEKRREEKIEMDGRVVVGMFW